MARVHRFVQREQGYAINLADAVTVLTFVTACLFELSARRGSPPPDRLTPPSRPDATPGKLNVAVVFQKFIRIGGGSVHLPAPACTLPERSTGSGRRYMQEATQREQRTEANPATAESDAARTATPRRLPAVTSMHVVPAPSLAPPRAEALRDHLLFADLSHAQLAALRATCQVELIDAGEVLYRRGQRARDFFLVLEGQIHLSLHSSNGEEKIVEIIPAGEVFAEAVMFLEEPSYQLTASAAITTRIARFGSERYLELLGENPKTCLRMLGHMSRRLHGRIRDIEHLSFASANDRLIQLLLARLPDRGGPLDLRLAESRQELAALLSMQPETLSRALRALVASGVLRVEGRLIRVPDRNRLKARLQAQD